MFWDVDGEKIIKTQIGLILIVNLNLKRVFVNFLVNTLINKNEKTKSVSVLIRQGICLRYLGERHYTMLMKCRKSRFNLHVLGFGLLL